MECFLIFSFALTQKKQKVKAARSTLLHGVFPLKKKNSLRSNSFFFLTLHHSIPLNATIMRPILFRSLCIAITMPHQKRETKEDRPHEFIPKQAKLKWPKAEKPKTVQSATSEAKKQAKQSLNDPKPHQRRETQRLASWILREEISRNGALRRGDCLSEASLSPFSGMQTDFSKIRAALNFCFFWFKPKENKNAVFYQEQFLFLCIRN